VKVWLVITLLLAIFLLSVLIKEKRILIRKKINIKLYQTAGFLAIVIVMLPFIYFLWDVSPQALELKNILILASVVIFSIIANLFVFYSLKWEKITHIEPARLLEPLFTILLAILFGLLIDSTLYESNPKIIFPALLSGLALIFSHVKKHHLEFNKYFIAAILGSFFFALELVISRLILDFYSPISFYFVRCLVIFIICFIIFKPKFKKLDVKVKWTILGVGVIWVLYRVMVYYGYLNLGVIFTTLMIMLAPIFIYLFAWKFLKEKLNWRNLVAAGVIVLSVLYAILA
jgi:drug/metabolite transporter (DMT)-like permease